MHCIVEKLENIIFDKQEQDLFLIDDLQLKAKAIRYSILPKMQVLMNYTINQIVILVKAILIKLI